MIGGKQRVVYTGPKGGKYYMKGGEKNYLKGGTSNKPNFLERMSNNIKRRQLLQKIRDNHPEFYNSNNQNNKESYKIMKSDYNRFIKQEQVIFLKTKDAFKLLLKLAIKYDSRNKQLHANIKKIINGFNNK